MNIAHIAPYSITFPLTKPNGRYTWVSNLAKLQAEAGHTVTVYCNPSSHIEGVKTIGIKTSVSDKDQNNIHTFQLAFQNNHDIYHSHFDSLHYELAHLTDKPVVYTQHWWPNDTVIEYSKKNVPKNIWAVPPTKYMSNFDTESNIQTKGHIYHGIDLTLFQPSHKYNTGRLLYVGRISPEKNLELVLNIATKSKLGLDIIGKIEEKNKPYWNSLAIRFNNGDIKYLGTKSPKELTNYYSSCLGLLFPSHTHEPFGLVAIEAQACGAAVLMNNDGSRKELIDEGKTGFLCDNVDDFIFAISKLYTLQPINSIQFAKKFDIQNMTKKYEALYQELISPHIS